MKELQNQFIIEPHPHNVSVARGNVKQVAAQIGFIAPDLDDIELAVGEAVSNAILYGSPAPSCMVSVCCYLDLARADFSIEVRDYGPGFNVEDYAGVPDLDSLHGRGLYMMRNLMDQVHLHHADDGMFVNLVKRVPA